MKLAFAVAISLQLVFLINALNADYNDVFIDMQESQTLEE